jgi:hypothetical protein
MNWPNEAKCAVGRRVEFHCEWPRRVRNSHPTTGRRLLWPDDRVRPCLTQHRRPVEEHPGTERPGNERQGGRVPPDVGEADSAGEATSLPRRTARLGARKHLSLVQSLESPLAKRRIISCCFPFTVQPRFAGNRTLSAVKSGERTLTVRHSRSKRRGRRVRPLLP